MEKCKVGTRNIAALLCAIVCVLSISIGLIVWGNTTVGTTYYEIASDRLPHAFDGFKIAQISDLHNAELGKDNSKILTALQGEAPDLIALAGDLIDSKRTDTEIAIGFVRQAMQIAPCYFVTGNHEAWSGAAYEEMETRLVGLGVRVLHDETLTLTREGE
ncbi:MAG: metallophosphoesterase, partial [Christensenellaceae bacterium]